MPETNNMQVDDSSGVVKFNDSFACLGSIIAFALDDDVDVTNRFSKSSKHVGSLHFMWSDDDAPSSTKVKLHDVMSLNLLLWG